MRAQINSMPTEELNITLNQIAKKYRSLDYVRHIYKDVFNKNFRVNYDYVENGIEKTKTFKLIYRMYCLNISKLAVEMYMNEMLPASLRLQIHSDYAMCPEIYENFKKFMAIANPCMTDKEFLTTLKDVKSAPLRETFVEFFELVKDLLMTSGASFYSLAYLNRIHKVETSLLREINLC